MTESRQFLRGLGAAMPVYVTRKTGSGDVMTYSLSIWMTFLAIFFVWINVVLWGVIGIWKAVEIL